MDQRVAQALRTDRIVDITTIGRKTGKPRRVEIALIDLEDCFVLSGSPGRPRNWYANLCTHPEFTVHLKKSFQVDLPARGMPVRDDAQRRDLVSRMAERDPRRREINVEEWVAGAPLVKVEILSS